MERVAAERFVDELRMAARWNVKIDFVTQDLELYVWDSEGNIDLYVGPTLHEIGEEAFKLFAFELRRATMTQEIRVNWKEGI